MPTISTIVVCERADLDLRPCRETIEGQTVPPCEIIVVGPGESADTLKIDEAIARVTGDFVHIVGVGSRVPTGAYEHACALLAKTGADAGFFGMAAKDGTVLTEELAAGAVGPVDALKAALARPVAGKSGGYRLSMGNKLVSARSTRDVAIGATVFDLVNLEWLQSCAQNWSVVALCPDIPIVQAAGTGVRSEPFELESVKPGSITPRITEVYRVARSFGDEAYRASVLRYCIDVLLELSVFAAKGGRDDDVVAYRKCLFSFADADMLQWVMEKYVSAAIEFDQQRAVKDAAIAWRDEQIATRDAAIAWRDELLSSKDAAIAWRDEKLAAKDETLSRQDERVAAKDAAIAWRDERIASKDAAIAWRDGRIAAKDREIARREREITWRENDIAIRDEQLALRDREIERLEEELEKPWFAKKRKPGELD